MFKLPSFLEGFTSTVGGKSTQVAGLVEVELSRVRSVIKAAVVKSDSTVSNAIYGVQEGFSAEAYCDSPSLSARGWSDPP